MLAHTHTHTHTWEKLYVRLCFSVQKLLKRIFLLFFHKTHKIRYTFEQLKYHVSKWAANNKVCDNCIPGHYLPPKLKKIITVSPQSHHNTLNKRHPMQSSPHKQYDHRIVLKRQHSTPHSHQPYLRWTLPNITPVRFKPSRSYFTLHYTLLKQEQNLYSTKYCGIGHYQQCVNSMSKGSLTVSVHANITSKTKTSPIYSHHTPITHTTNVSKCARQGKFLRSDKSLTNNKKIRRKKDKYRDTGKNPTHNYRT